LYISHDLATINYLTDRAMIMYLGDIVEIGPTADVIASPSHPYTEQLISAVPDPDPDAPRSSTKMDEGDIGDPTNLPDGCRFAPRCPYAEGDCRASEPDLESVGTDREAACYFPLTDS